MSWKTILSFVISFTFFSFETSAEPTTIKCHVELLGGNQRIHSVTFEQSDVNPKALEEDLVNFRIYGGDGGKKQAIYKVYECVNSNDKFSDRRAKRLEETLAQ